MEAIIQDDVIVLSGDPLKRPHRIRLGVMGPEGLLLCTFDGREGYCVQKSEYNRIPKAARDLLGEGISARKGERTLTIHTFDPRAQNRRMGQTRPQRIRR